MPRFGNPSELIDPLQYVRPRDILLMNLGKSFPDCSTNVELFVNTAPEDDSPIFINASIDPVRGPLAL
jgi:hypothetical protein